jgi:hypothetical protein
MIVPEMYRARVTIGNPVRAVQVSHITNDGLVYLKGKTKPVPIDDGKTSYHLTLEAARKHLRNIERRKARVAKAEWELATGKKSDYEISEDEL